MKVFLIGLGLHLLVLACNAKNDEKNEKELVNVQVEPTKVDDRLKRASTQDELKLLRQPAEVPPEYLSFLQQLSAQRDQTPAAQQPQYIQQLVLPKDGLKQATPTRYILSQDGRLIDESVAYLTQQLAAAPSPYVFQQPQSQPQAQQPPLARPTVSPELAEFSRQQQRLQQQYADAPLRAQITGSAVRARQRQGQPTPSGPNSQSPQVFLQSQQRNEARLRTPVPTESPNFVYAPVPADAQAILQQQLAQLSIAGEADGRQFYVQAPRTILPQQILYQQPAQQDFTQERVIYQQPQQQPQQLQQLQQQHQPQQQQQFATRRPVPVTPSPQTQTLTQNLPQQYLIETTRSQQQSAHYVPQEVAQQVQYVQPSQIVSQQAGAAQPKQQFSSTLLQPVANRALFDPKPSRSSIFVSRSSSTPRPVPLDTESQKIPVVRLPSPTDQRPLTRQELEALVNAGFSVSPVPVPVPVPVPIRGESYLKSKRQQPIILEEGKNHVVYENHQDGVQYQYSPGSTATKIKKSVTASSADDVKSPNKALVNENSGVLTYVLALGNESS